MDNSVEIQVIFANKENEEKAAEILKELVHSERANFSHHWKTVALNASVTLSFPKARSPSIGWQMFSMLSDTLL